VNPVNRILIAKTRRDMRRRRAQFVAITLTVAIGVMLFIATYDAYRNLGASYDRSYDRLHFADVTATGGAPHRTADAARGVEGVEAVTTRSQVDLPLAIGDDKLIGRAVALPADRQPAVNRVDVNSGRYLDPDRPDGVLLEHHAADTFGLSPGDRLRAFGRSGWRTLTVLGLAESPEYLWPAPDRQNVLFDPKSFAVLFAQESTVRDLAGARAVLAQTLVELTPRGRDGDAAHEVTERLRASGARDVQPRSQQASYASLQEDLEGFSQLAVAFPALFLSAAAIAAYVLITRLVLSERRVIATFLASGAPRGRVLRHYLGHGLLAGTAGGVAGVVTGAFATAVLTHLYTSSIDLPDTVVSRRWGAALVGVLFGVLVGLVGGAAPAVSTARTAPAQAMRGDTGTARPPGRWDRLVAGARRLPVTWRLALRELTRSRRRTLATMTGTVLALVLILSSVGMVTSMRSALDLAFGEIARQDATVTIDPAVPGLGQQVRKVPGVERVEISSEARVTASAGKRSYATTLTGFRPETTLHGFHTTDGGWRELPPDGSVLAGEHLTDRLDIGVGDTFTVTSASGTARRVRLAGLLSEPMGTVLYGTLGTIGAATGEPADTLLLRYSPGTDADARDRVRATVAGLDGVVAFTDERALKDQINTYLAFFWIFVGLMIGLGAVLAFTVIYVTMTVNIAERTGELATWRASGVPLHRIGALLATENTLATVIATPLGLAAGAYSAWAFLRSFDNDMFSIELSLGWVVLATGAGAVLVASLVSQIPAMRGVRRLDIATVVRERSQ
jgi:putative ABC transport system permease protein